MRLYGFVVASGDPTQLLQLVDESLDGVAAAKLVAVVAGRLRRPCLAVIAARMPHDGRSPPSTPLTGPLDESRQGTRPIGIAHAPGATGDCSPACVTTLMKIFDRGWLDPGLIE